MVLGRGAREWVRGGGRGEGVSGRCEGKGSVEWGGGGVMEGVVQGDKSCSVWGRVGERKGLIVVKEESFIGFAGGRGGGEKSGSVRAVEG